MLSPVARSTESFRLTFHWVTFKALESDSVDSSNNKSQSGQPFGTPLRKVLNRRSFALAYQCQSSLWLHVDVHSQFTDHLLARLHGETDGVFYGTRSTRFYSRVTKSYESFRKWPWSAVFILHLYPYLDNCSDFYVFAFSCRFCNAFPYFVHYL